VNPQQQRSEEVDSDYVPVSPQTPVVPTQPSVEVTAQAAPVFTSVKQEIPITLEDALIRTLAMLQQHNLASAEDCSQVAATIRRNWEAGKGSDPIDCLARLRSAGGDMLDASVEMISVKLANSMAFVPSRVGFAARLIPPTAFYEKNPNIAMMCKLMLVPVTFAEDEDVIGIASINPYFADALSAMICEEIKAKNKVQPVVSIVRLDYIGWMKMCQKHFKEESPA